MRKYKRYSKFSNNIIVSHVQNNLREYIIAAIIFVIGILLGIVFVNNLNNTQSDEIKTYIDEAIAGFKGNDNINKLIILKNEIQSDFLLTVLLWLLGSTVIGLLLVYLIVCFKGFCLGYTISAVVFSIGTGKAVIFLLSTIFLKHLISIPAILALAVSGMKLYKSIMQDRRKENVKLEVIRHTLFSLFILLILIASSIIEVYVSQSIFTYCLKYL